MRNIVFLPLMSTGSNKKTSRRLRFEIKITEIEAIRYDTLQKETLNVVTICGGIKKNGGCCQCKNEIYSFANRVPDNKKDDFERLMMIWEDYHMNNYKNGTNLQEQAIGMWKQYHDYDYIDAKEYLKSIGLESDRGYVYGSGYLCKPIPESEIEFLNRIIKEWSEEELQW